MLWSSRESGRRFLVTVEISTNLTVIGKPPGFVRIRKLIKEWWIANARLSIFTEWASRESGRRFSIPVKISTNSAVIGKLPAFVRKSKLETAEFTNATIGSVNRTFCCHGLAKGYWWGGGGGLNSQLKSHLIRQLKASPLELLEKENVLGASWLSTQESAVLIRLSVVMTW